LVSCSANAYTAKYVNEDSCYTELEEWALIRFSFLSFSFFIRSVVGALVRSLTTLIPRKRNLSASFNPAGRLLSLTQHVCQAKDPFQPLFGLHAYFDFIAPALLLIRDHELLLFDIRLLVVEDEA